MVDSRAEWSMPLRQRHRAVGAGRMPYRSRVLRRTVRVPEQACRPPLHAAGESAVTTPEHGKPIVLVKMERWLVAFSGTFTGSAGGFDRSSLRHGQRDWQPKLPLA
jgi:hypothetical protein